MCLEQVVLTKIQNDMVWGGGPEKGYKPWGKWWFKGIGVQNNIQNAAKRSLGWVRSWFFSEYWSWEQAAFNGPLCWSNVVFPGPLWASENTIKCQKLCFDAVRPLNVPRKRPHQFFKILMRSDGCNELILGLKWFPKCLPFLGLIRDNHTLGRVWALYPHDSTES